VRRPGTPCRSSSCRHSGPLKTGAQADSARQVPAARPPSKALSRASSVVVHEATGRAAAASERWRARTKSGRRDHCSRLFCGRARARCSATASFRADSRHRCATSVSMARRFCTIGSRWQFDRSGSPCGGSTPAGGAAAPIGNWWLMLRTGFDLQPRVSPRLEPPSDGRPGCSRGVASCRRPAPIDHRRRNRGWSGG
jgi:hypothetical protein